MAEENMQDMESKREKSAAEKKAAQAAKKGAKKAAKSLKNGGKLAKFFANPVGLIILAVILAIIMLIGFLSFFLSMPGKVLGQIFDFFNGMWANIVSFFWNGTGAYMQETEIVEVGQYLEDMGYDLESYGFGENVEYVEDPEQDDGIAKTEKGGKQIKTTGSGLYDEDGVLYNYIWSDLNTYALSKFTLGWSGNAKTGMINIESNDADWIATWGDNIDISRKDKIMTIKRWNPEGWAIFNNDTYVFDIDGWSGRYGKPLELLLTLHLATMTPDVSMALATRSEFDTKVNIGLKEQENFVTVSYKKNDGTEVTPEKMRDAYIDLRQSALENLDWIESLYREDMQKVIDATEEILGTYDEFNSKGTTEKIETLLNEEDLVDGLGVVDEEDVNLGLIREQLFKKDLRIPNKLIESLLYNTTLTHSLDDIANSIEKLAKEQNVEISSNVKNILNKYKDMVNGKQLYEMYDLDYGIAGITHIGEIQIEDNSTSDYTTQQEYEFIYFCNINNKDLPFVQYVDNYVVMPKFSEDPKEPDARKTFYIKNYSTSVINAVTLEDINSITTEEHKEKLIKLYEKFINMANDMKLVLDESDRIADIAIENSDESVKYVSELGLTFKQLKEATEINYGETGSGLTKESKIVNNGKGKDVQTYQPYIKSVKNSWFRDVTFKGETEVDGKTVNVNVYEGIDDKVTNSYEYKPQEGSDSSSLVANDNGAFWISEIQSQGYKQTSQPVVGPINENTIKLFAGDDMEVGTDDDPKYYIYDGTKRTAQLISSTKTSTGLLNLKNAINLEIIEEFITSNEPNKFVNSNKTKIINSINAIKVYLKVDAGTYDEWINQVEVYDDILNDYENASTDSKEKLNEVLNKMIEKIKDVNHIFASKKTVSLDRSSLTAFSILENAGTLDSEYILRDLKELLIELKYFTEDDFIEYDTNVLEFIVPNAQIEPDEATGKIQWPDAKVYEDESKTEKPVMEYYTGIRKERFNVGDSVIAPGTGIITDSTDTSVTIKFITPTQIEGMKITIEGFDVDISNATNIIYDGKTEKKIEKGATIGKTSTTMIKMYLYDVDDSIINDIEEYMNPFALTKNDMVVKVDDPRSPKIVTDKETLKSVIEKGWNTSRDKSNLTSDEVLEAMLKAQETYDVNALFLAAITIKESSAGTGWDLIDSSTYNWCSIQGSYNGESYTDRNGTKWKKYPSFAEAITDCAKLIAETGPYFKDGRIWISTIGKKYCPPGTEWSEGVANIMSNFYKNVY